MDLNERGIRDGLGAMADIRRTVAARAADAERRFGEAEAEYNSLLKLLGFVDERTAGLRAQLAEIERKKEQPK